MRVTRRTALLGGLAAAGFGCPGFGCRPAAAAPATPRLVVEGFYAVLLDTMKQATSLRYEGRYRQLQPAIEAAFNLPLMIRLAVGPQWNTLTPPQQDRLLDSFRRFTVATYASRFDGFQGEHFEVTGEAPSPTGGTLVDTRLVSPKDDPVELNYLLRQGDAGWQIIDVFLSGTISQLATWRAEFTSVLRRDGADGLVALLEQKVAALTPR
jgi:phospholipid transport system substrate-binding protein